MLTSGSTTSRPAPTHLPTRLPPDANAGAGEPNARVSLGGAVAGRLLGLRWRVPLGHSKNAVEVAKTLKAKVNKTRRRIETWLYTRNNGPQQRGRRALQKKSRSSEWRRLVPIAVTGP